MKRASAVLATGLTAALLLCALPANVPAQSETQRLELKAREFAFNPREVTVRSGEVVIIVTNEGGMEHALIVEDENRTTLAEIPSVLPEKTEQVRGMLKPGTYSFFCPLASGLHRRLGMVGVLKVTE